MTRLSEHEVTLTESEDRLLGQLLTWAKRYGDVADAKAGKLLDLLALSADRTAPGTASVSSCTPSIETHKSGWPTSWEARGLGGAGLQLLYGGMDEDDREQIKNAFQAPPDGAPVRILLATDCTGERI
ncbi:MAG: hypothetical protein JOY61_23875 [Chloroflexi bacterium]|nr:hypothetical protein [Chloroflexota bacterium]